MHFLVPWTYHLFLSMNFVDSPFLKLPQCLCIHLQRLSWSNQGTPLKRHEHVQFNEFLVMDIYKYRVPGPKSSQEQLSQKSSEETTPGVKDGRAGKPSGTSFAHKIVQVFLHFQDQMFSAGSRHGHYLDVGVCKENRNPFAIPKFTVQFG